MTTAIQPTCADCRRPIGPYEMRLILGDAIYHAATCGPAPLFRDKDAEIARLRVALRDQAGVELSEENDRLIDEITRLRAQRDQLLAALKPMVDAWDMSGDEGQHRRIWDTARAAIAAVKEKP